MPITRWDQRFFATTRGQVVTLLRRTSHTVEELATALGLTDNAVRAHLAALERDGIVTQRGVRRGVGKPAYSYELAPDAERLFPKPYDAVLRELLAVLAARLAPAELEAIVRDTGRRLAEGQRAPNGDLRSRVAYAVALLNDLGGLAECEPANGSFVIQGYSCPLAAAVPGYPGVCALAETLLAEVVGAEVREQCERGDAPRCRFEVRDG